MFQNMINFVVGLLLYDLLSFAGRSSMTTTR